MWLMQIGLAALILILIYNAVYSFLPVALQGIWWIKTIAVISALVILIWGIKQAIQDYRNYRFAYVSAKDGEILKKKNFPWKVTKTLHEGKVIYIINERYGDASEISIKPDKANTNYTVYNAIDGVGIKFSCPDNEISNFKIIIR
jgi:hypothetical protein